jgi:multiple sugar transport system permease protein
VTTTLRHRTSRGLRRLWERELYPYVLLAPAVLILGVLILYPIETSIDLSFHNVPISQIDKPFGEFTLQNYTRLFQSPQFLPALRVSLIYIVVVTIFAYLIGIGTAAMLNQKFVGRRVARLLIVVPWAVPLVVASNIFWWLFDKTYGLVNYLLVSTNLIQQPIDWFLDANAAMIAVCVTTIWKGYPFFTIMLLAGMQAIPQELYDAAKVDGATSWRAFIAVTLPALNSITGIALLINVLWVFREFTVIFILTGGGPVNATTTLSVWTYLEAFGNFNMGYAGAIGVLTLIISVIFGFFFVRMSSTEFA